jgi:hypothetical protein
MSEFREKRGDDESNVVNEAEAVKQAAEELYWHVGDNNETADGESELSLARRLALRIFTRMGHKDEEEGAHSLIEDLAKDIRITFKKIQYDKRGGDVAGYKARIGRDLAYQRKLEAEQMAQDQAKASIAGIMEQINTEADAERKE